MKAARAWPLAAFFAFFNPTFCQTLKKVKAPSIEIDLSTQYWVDAFDFFQSEGDSPSLEALRTKAVEKKYSNIKVIKKILDSLVNAKDRGLLLENMNALVQKNECPLDSQNSIQKPICEQLRKLWINNLESIYFYEETAGKIERTRRFLLSKECDKALILLKEIGQKEGAFVGATDLFQKTYLCLGDDGNRVAKEAELQKLKIFEN